MADGHSAKDGRPAINVGRERQIPVTPEGLPISNQLVLVSPPTSSTSSFPNVEVAVITALFLILLAAKLSANFHYRIDSDEPQHVHVVWSWLHGQVAYRDFFDNHTPLFHLLCVPWLSFFGEHSKTLLQLRLTSLAGYAGCLLLAYRLVCSFGSRRLAASSALVLGCFPPFFLTSTEYRPDILWTFLWLASLTTLVQSQGRPSAVGKAFFFLGLAFCVSMKSTLMLIAIALAVLVLFLGEERSKRSLVVPRGFAVTLSAVGGLAVAPAVLVVYFWAHGALNDAYYCIIQHNLLPGEHSPGKTLARLLQGALAMVIPAGLCILAWRKSERGTPTRRLIFLWLVTATLFISLRCFWRFLTAEDYLPVFGLLVPLETAALLDALPGGFRVLVLPVIAAGLMIFAGCQGRIWQNSTHRKLHLVADVLRLTEAGTPVMDAKGETMFRTRASRLVLEHLSILRVKQGLLQDDIAQEMVAKQVPVVSDFKLSNKAQVFTGRYYLRVGWRLSVLGHALQPTSTPSGVEWRFETVVPGAYSFIDPRGLIEGQVDDRPCINGSIYLRPGFHVLRCGSRAGPIDYEWTHALEKGFSPFTHIPSDRKRAED